jgi:hypothetical protein
MRMRLPQRTPVPARLAERTKRVRRSLLRAHGNLHERGKARLIEVGRLKFPSAPTYTQSSKILLRASHLLRRWHVGLRHRDSRHPCVSIHRTWPLYALAQRSVYRFVSRPSMDSVRRNRFRDGCHGDRRVRLEARQGCPREAMNSAPCFRLAVPCARRNIRHHVAFPSSVSPSSAAYHPGVCGPATPNFYGDSAPISAPRHWRPPGP